MDVTSRTLNAPQEAGPWNGPRPEPDIREPGSTSKPFAPVAPLPNLPKGGGAIRGIGEKFTTIPARGAASLSIPLPLSPGRAGLTPQLSLVYDSGSGNGPFGLGWSLTVPSISRKTDKGLPKYADEDESDVFILSGAEDLVPEYKKDDGGKRLAGQDGNLLLNEELREAGGARYRVRRYRPRTEGLFARVERWTSVDSGEIHWRSISKDNVVSYYGIAEHSLGTSGAEPRITDPTASQRDFSWLLCGSRDDKGNAVLYQYKSENSDGIDTATASESNRLAEERASNRYLKRILYGNTESLVAEGPISSPLGPDFAKVRWHFELVLDYGEGHVLPVATGSAKGDLVVASLAEGQPWLTRLDAFSSYRPTFEVRTYRLCRRILMFHHFEAETGLGTPDYLVKSLDLEYDETSIAATLRSATICGYVRQADGKYLRKPLPPLEMEYSVSPLEDFRPDGFPVQDLDPSSLENVPAGTWSGQYRWVDLDGEGIAGLLSEQANAWYFKPNLGAGRLNGLRKISPLPALADSASPRQHLMDLNGDGHLDLVELGQSVGGYYQRSDDFNWVPFQPFRRLPNLEWQDSEVRFADLTGDGLTDVFVTQWDSLTWFESLGGDGFDLGIRLHLPIDEDKGPRQIRADARQAVFLADMSGDGLADIVRVRQGEVCYWPNLGYGRFGRRVAMTESPWFEPDGHFDPRRVQLVDVDGSGPADLIYHAADGARIYLNEAGNGWSTARVLSSVPPAHDLSSLDAVDLLGTGTACLVWSSSLPGDARRSMRFVDLMKGRKPHLLVRFENNLGAETRLEYESSTRFYLSDKSEGKPWVTRLPFPVQVVTRVDSFDRISRNRFVSRFSYHHGYFDGVEREFRGFGRVDQWDSEEFASLSPSGEPPSAANVDAASHVPPVLTRTWFHTGAYFGRERVTRVFAEEYYREPRHRGDTTAATSLLLEDTVLPPGLSADEEREACRVLRGQMLRQEVYAHDGSMRSDEPYLLTEQNFTIELVQPRAQNRHAVFFSHPRESLTFHYERNPDHPRIAHAMTLEVDSFGNRLKNIDVNYGRRIPGPDPGNVLTNDDQIWQATTLITYTESCFTNAIDQRDVYRCPLPSEVRVFELTGYKLQVGKERFGLSNFIQVADGHVDLISDREIPYDIQPNEVQQNPVQQNPILPIGGKQRRLIEHERVLYRRDDFTGPLPLGQLESLAVPFESYKLAFTPQLLAALFDGSVTTAMMESEGQYRHVGGDANWWVPSGRILYSPERTDTDSQELHFARHHFFRPSRFRNPFHSSLIGTETTVRYDVHDLVVLETEDALGNRTTAGGRDPSPEGTVQPAIDYRTLQPVLVMDPNGNRTFVAFDALGMVVGSAVAGKPSEHVGDSIDGFEADLAHETVEAHLSNPVGRPHEVLRKATTRIIYDLFAYQKTKGSPQPLAPVVYTLTRETHESYLVVGEQTKIQHSLAYSDGFGRVIQKKIRAESGPTPRRDPATGRIVVSNGQPQLTTSDVDPRWVGTGWTVYNNKGKPVRQFEPFFSDTHLFEFDVRIGVSSILFYDPPGRLIATLHPNHTWEKVVFDTWTRESWDVNDTVRLDPQTDADVSGHFSRLAVTEYLPTWASQRLGGALGTEEQAAANQAAAHASTPSVSYLNARGRSFLTIADNGPAGKYATRVLLDIEDNPREVRDPKNRIVVQYSYDMLGNRVFSWSMDAGKRWMLNDAAGQALYSWDSREHRFHTIYDRLGRIMELRVSEGKTPEFVAEQLLYGEELANPEAANLRGRLHRHNDQAGQVTIQRYDFKGNQLDQTRQLSKNYKSALNWSAGFDPEAETYRTTSRFDALNRPIEMVAPDGSVVRPAFNESNLLQSVNAVLAGDAGGRSTQFVTNIDYNAKGQRLRLEYGNAAITEYEYDSLTSRLAKLVTKRAPSAFPNDGKQPAPVGWPGKFVQNLNYTYDPVGNITTVRDDAQQIIFYNNARVDPSCQYVYDAVYRLVEATGREHLGQNREPVPLDAFGFNHSGIPHPSDGNAMGRYCEKFLYDAVGNILEVQHRTAGAANPTGWTRQYRYTDASLIEPTKPGNGLSSTMVGATAGAYRHDAHGNMTAMAHLSELRWNYRDQLSMTWMCWLSNVPGVFNCEATYYTYDSEGQRVRKVTERQDGTRKTERVYLGPFEIYRKYDASGRFIAVERQTLHVSDDRRKIAMVERRTIGSEGEERLIRFQLDNHIGSACIELDQASNVISYEEYFPYGATSFQAMRGQLGANPKRYRFTGKERDEESGLYYFGARYYASWLGRWISCDPKEPPETVQPYEYCRGNPIGRLDRTGGESEWCFFCNPLSSDISFEPGRFAKEEVAPRAVGALQLAGATAEGFAAGALIATPEPTMATKVAGWALAVDASDNAASAVRRIITGGESPTLKAVAGEAAARAAGASEPGAKAVGAYVEFGVSLLTTVVGGRLLTPRSPVGAGQSVVSVPKTVAAESDAVFGPAIGRSGYHTVAEFNRAVGTKYQQLVDQAYADTMDLVSRGLLKNNPTVIGTRMDSIARTGLRDWLRNVEGIEEGVGQIIQVNRRLYSPTGSGAFRIPDVYVPGAQAIYDATIAEKTVSLPQSIDFRVFSGGGNVTIIRPSTLVTPAAQGSYGLHFP